MNRLMALCVSPDPASAWLGVPAFLDLIFPICQRGNWWKAHNVSPGGKSGGLIHSEGHLV